MYQFQFGREKECVFSEIPGMLYLIFRKISYFNGTTAYIKEQNCENADFNIMGEFTTEMIKTAPSTYLVQFVNTMIIVREYGEILGITSR